MKENSNPTIHAVGHRRRKAVIEKQFHVNSISNSEKPLFLFTESHERSVTQALKTAGSSDIILHTTSYEAHEETKYSYPLYIPFSLRSNVSTNTGSNRKRDAIDAEEVFDMIRDINDPEHPLTLEQLNVVCQDHIDVRDIKSTNEKSETKELLTSPSSFSELSIVDVKFTPTIPHCSMATLIGLSIRVKLIRSLPPRFKVHVRINPGTHASEKAINRQLNDKERVAAALENTHLLGVVQKCIA